MSTHRYAVTTTWTGDRGTGTSGYRDYARDVSIRVAGKPELEASADRPFRGDPAKWNPEDMLMAALSECHLLSYLHAATTRGVVVTGYEDAAEGDMELAGNAGRFTRVVLRPRVVIAEEGMRQAAADAHHDAHEWCFIANSVAFPVEVRPEIVVA
ncbi:OsmC family protein [Microbacterium sp. ZXX196]|uniref:OsmC family protein n=1 Tax=Microbacterium sp. ZXX196 TaxID=2609291 RepID=UPI0012B8EB01|nr:OsmC family protein [Microbacterium sp. ZXX196]MTE23098.1 OsmC family peroxiredoxin [Microbacterium sp. ZXX196]